MPATSPPANASLGYKLASVRMMKRRRDLPGAGGITYFALLNFMNGIFLNFNLAILLADTDNGWFGALCYDCNSLALGVFLW
jgi:hypothetical protein